MSNRSTLNLDFTDYLVTGEVEVTFWDNTCGLLQMKPFNIEDPNDIPKHINDGGFGTQSIDKAYVTMYENYQGYYTNPKELKYEGCQLVDSKRGI